ncbi:MAG: DUF3168 domain-containing protein [Cyclobacteriaceae bacterium]
MAAELALIGMLKNDPGIQGFCGTTPTRVFPFHIPQTTTLPAIIVRATGNDPNGTMTGPSELDFERVQVLIYDNEFNNATFNLETRVRQVLDRPASGSVNGIDVDGCSFEDRDTFKDQLIDKEVFAIEHIYKVIIKR